MRAGAVVALLVGVVGVVGVVGPRAAAAPPPDAGGDTAGDAVDDDRAGDAVDDAVAVFDATLTERAGFAHIVHDGKVSVSGGDPVACATCHALDRQGRPRGRPGHAACFGACHGAAPAPAPRLRRGRAATPYRIAAEQARVCAACHAPAALARLAAAGVAPTVAYPPYALDPDYGLAMSHAAHDAVATCERCHPATPGAAAATTGRAGRGGRGAPSPAPHDRCTGCHLAPAEGSDAPPMTACTSCHQAAYGPARGPTMVAGAFELGAGFGHADHAARIAAPCKACHGAVATTAGGDVPAPTTADCGAGGCHDGVAAFATTVACNRCHVAAPTVSYKLDITITPYSHERHRAILPDGACGGCHDLDARGEAPAPGHLACADAGCHRDDFARTAPVTCGACHVSIEPWRPLRADALPRPETEFGSTMPHHRHADLALTCAACHQLAAGTRDRRPPRGHVSCTGDACHRVGAGPTPRLDACSDCHRVGLVAARERDRRRAPWSVRARFEHAPHAAEAGGAPLACERCHAAVWDSDGPPAPPTKDACRGCHDGGVAFKLTGHACARCHGGG